MPLSTALASLRPSLSVRFASYRQGTPVAEGSAAAAFAGGEGRIVVGPDTIAWRLRCLPAEARADAIDIELEARHAAGWGVEDGSIGLRLSFASWHEGVYVLAPGSIYAGNRFASVSGLAYPPMVPPALARPDGEPLICESIPHLARTGASAFALRAGEMATPSVAVFDPRHRCACILLFAAHGEAGENGIMLREADDRGSAELTLLAPGVREGQRNSTHPERARPDRGHAWNWGHRVRLRARLLAFACADIPALFARFAEVRRDLSGEPIPPATLPFSAAAAQVAGKRNRENWHDGEERFDTTVDQEGRPGGFQLGWCGGLIDLPPMLRFGGAEGRRRAVRALDRFLAPRSHAACGLWYDRWRDAELQRDQAAATAHWTLVRRHGDALLAAAKAVVLLARLEPDRPLPPAWRDSLRKEGEALLAVWQRHGALGQWIDLATGAIAVGDSSSGAIVPAGLALAGQVLGEPAWLPAAAAMAERFARRELQQGFANGGPGDALQVPDSESAFALVESFAVLHALTGDRRWAHWAGQAADQAASWVMTRDHPLPPASPLGQIGALTTGTVFANAQNRHSAPGICTLSGDALLRTARASGQLRHLDLLHDIARALPQFVSRADRPIGGMRPGWMNERVNTCDWEAAWGRDAGDIFAGSCWCEVSMLLTAAEVPGVYVRSDLGRAWAMDHVSAEVVAADPDGVRLRLANGTAFPAEVRILAEDAAGAVVPLPFDGTWELPSVRIEAGHEVRITCPLRRPGRRSAVAS